MFRTTWTWFSKIPKMRCLQLDCYSAWSITSTIEAGPAFDICLLFLGHRGWVLFREMDFDRIVTALGS